MTELAPLDSHVLVAASPAVAFDVFTSRIGDWWPIAQMGVHGDGSVAFDDGALVETAANGDRAVWGTVSTWEPPDRLALTWHPGRSSDTAARIALSFEARGDETLVTLRHAGWEVYPDPESSRDEYARGWPTVLGRYRDDVG